MAQFDTDKMAQEVAEKAMKNTDFYGKSLAEWIDEMKSGKAIPIVRCRDCAYFGYDKFGDAGCCAPVGLNAPDEDSFCSYGKRREADDRKQM